jgi:LysR family transcriptional regulator, regulator of abg operon
MNLRHLELLRHVVDAGGLSAGARAAGISQPAMSQAMAALARTMDVSLFVRHGRTLRPTQAALSMARAAASADALERQVEAAARQAPVRRHAGGLLRAGLAPAAGLLYGPGMARALVALRARPLLSIITGAAPRMLEQLARGELDLVIAPRPRGLQRPGLHHHLMYLSQPLIFARQGHPLSNATTLQALARADWVVAGDAGTPGNIVEEAFRVRRLRPPRIVVQCADYPMLLAMLAGTDLLGVISHPSLVDASRLREIRPLHIAEGLPHYDVCLFWYDASVRPWPPGMAEVLDQLRSGSVA